MVACGCTNEEIAERLGAQKSGVAVRMQRIGLAIPRTASDNYRFDRLIDMVADAPRGRVLKIADAARRVGLKIDLAEAWWAQLCARYGEVPSHAVTVVHP